MDQHEFVAWSQEQYERLLMDPTTDGFEKAHYPLSKKKGNTTIPLHRLDHAIQGLWQSEEEGCVCFFTGDTKAALNSPNYFPRGWFDAWDLYDKWSGETGRWCVELGIGAHASENRGKGGRNGSINDKSKAGKKGGLKTKELGVAIFDPVNRSKSHKVCKRKGVGIYDPTNQKKGAEAMNSQKWISLVTGLVASPGGISSHHRRIEANTKARIQLTLEQYELVRNLPQADRLSALGISPLHTL